MAWTPQAFLVSSDFISSCSSFDVIGESSGFLYSFMVDSKLCSLSCMCFCSLYFSIGPKRSERWFTHTSPFWLGTSSCFCLFRVFQKWFVFIESSIAWSWFLTCWSLLYLSVFFGAILTRLIFLLLCPLSDSGEAFLKEIQVALDHHGTFLIEMYRGLFIILVYFCVHPPLKPSFLMEW